MYSFGNKRYHREKAKQPATVEKVAPIHTVILSEKKLEELTDLIYHQVARNLGYQQGKKAPDLKPVSPKKQVNNRGRCLIFSGTRKDPEVYLQWESNMEKWLQSNNIPKEQKLSRAVSAFTGKAHEWWLKENTSTNYKKPVLDWRDLKARMYEEFVEKYQATPIRLASTSPSAKEYGIKRQEEDIQDSIQQVTSRPEIDIRPINEAYKPNQEELSNKSTCSRNLTHQRVTEKKNWSKSFPHEEVIQLSSQQTSNESKGDQRLPIEEFQSNQEEPRCKLTYFGNPTHQRLTANLIYFKIPYGLKVIQLLNKTMPGVPYLEAHGFNHLQTRLWRPGEVYNYSRDISSHPGESSITLEGSDLGTNPFKGGGDGVIQISLIFKDLKINHESSNHDHFSQQIRYHGHSGRANTHLVYAESRDGRNSLLLDRSELVRPPDQLQEVILVSMDPMHVSAYSQPRFKAQKAQEDIKNELDLLMDESKKMWVEQSPYWPIKLKDRPPWASKMDLDVAQLENKIKIKPACWFN